MIHFSIKFIICFTKPKPPIKKEKMKKITGKGPSSRKKKGDSLEDVKLSKEEIPGDKIENIVGCTENAREWCHIEYCLLDDVLPKIELNVVTWGLAAKIFYKDDSRAVKTVVINDVVWIHFSVIHKILKFNDVDLEAFKNSTITFKFSQSQTNMMSSAANDWPKEFIICKKISDLDSSFSHWFPELRQTVPYDEIHKEAMKDRVEIYKMSLPDKENSIITMVQISLCGLKIEKKILDIMQTFPVVRASQEVMKKKGNKKRKKESKDLKGIKSDKKIKKKLSESDEDKSEIQLKGEVIIAGKSNICVEQKDISTSLKYVGVIVNSSKILTDDQDISFVPLTVTIQSVKNLPSSFIEKYKLRKVYAQYELANVLNNIETKVVPVRGSNASFDDTRVWFLSNPEERLPHEELMLRPSMLTLSEALLTRKFVVKLYGETEDMEAYVEPCLFGQRPTDPFISTPGHSMFLEYKPPPQMSANVFLGSACFNLIHLIKGHFKVEASSVLTSAPVSTWDPICDFEDLIKKEESVADQDPILMRFSDRGVIPESIFLEHCSHITVKVTIGCLLSHLTEHQLLHIPNIYHRLIIVFKEHKYAIQIFQHITETNLMLTGEATVSQVSTSTTKSTTSNIQEFQDSLEQNNNNSQLPSTISRIQELQNVSFMTHKTKTGFFLDCKEESIVVLEAIPQIFPHVTKSLHTLLPNDGRIIHDSSLFFTKRLYNGFFPKNLFRVKLSKPLSHLLRESSYYTKKSAPEQAMQTLLLVDFLRRSRTLNCASVNQLFPSCEQLISFKNVFGEASNISSLCSSESYSSTTSLNSLISHSSY